MADTGWIDAAYSVGCKATNRYVNETSSWVGENENFRIAVRWDEADFSLPGDETITKIEFQFVVDTIINSSGNTISLFPYDSDGQTDPSGESAANTHTHCDDGTALISASTSFQSTGTKTLELDSGKHSVIESAFTAGSIFSIGITGDNEGVDWGTNVRTDLAMTGDTTDLPKMRITYTTGGAGVPILVHSYRMFQGVI